MSFGTNIKKFRESQALSQNELANKINVTQPTVAMWETGVAMPRADKLPELAKILKCDVSDLFEKEHE